MKKLAKLILFICVVLTVSSCGMDNLPQGEFLTSAEAPNGLHRIDAYLCNGGATVDFAVRCAVVDIDSGEERNIYWQYHQQTAQIEWIDEETVEINGIRLNIFTDSYDWRKL